MFLKDEKRERFIKVAENRTNKILKTIKLLGNCSNRNNYDYTEDEIKTIFNAIEQELKKEKSKFEINSSREKFKLR